MGFSRQEDWSGVPLPSPVLTLLEPNTRSFDGGSLWKHRFDLLIREFILGKEKGGIGVLMGTSKLGDASKVAKTLVCISPIPSAP